jgi:hypothetical protein
MPQDSAVPLPRQMTTPGRRVEWRAAWRAFRVAAVYAVLAAVWLLAYGRGPVIPLQGPLGAVNVWHIFQGWLYVVLTATLLYALLREHDAALARERTAQRLLLGGAPAAIACQGRVVFASDAFAAVWGPFPDLTARVHPDDRTALLQALQSAAHGPQREGAAPTFSGRLADREGAWRAAAVTCYATAWQGRPATLCLLATTAAGAQPAAGEAARS